MAFFSTMFATKSDAESAPLVTDKPRQPADSTADAVAGKGMHNTACTDVFCLLIFIAYMVGVGYVMHIAMQDGDPRRLTHGFNWEGKLCGVDADVADKPLLFWCGGEGPRLDGFPSTLNFEDPICVQSCPTSAVEPAPVVTTVTTVAPVATAVTTVTTVAPVANAVTTVTTAAPVANAVTTVTTVAPPTATVTLPAALAAYGTAAPAPATAAPTTAAAARLLQELPFFYCPTPAEVKTTIVGVAPEVTKVQTITQSIQKQLAYNTKEYMGRYCMPDVPTDNPLAQEMLNSTGMSDGTEQLKNALGGVKRAWPVVASACGAALVMCFLYLILLKYCARILIYAALIILILGFLVIGLGLLSTAFDLTGNQVHSPLFQKLPHDDAVLYSEIGGGICLVMFLVFAILLMCFNHLIQTALRVVEAACTCMFSELDLLLQPLVDVVLRTIAFCVLAYGGIYVLSMGKVVADNSAAINGQTVAGVSRTIEYTDDQKYMIAYYVFGYFWIMELLNAMSQFVLAYMVVLWYYTKKESAGARKKLVFCAICKGYAASMVHLGSLAFGSFLIAVLRFVRLILGIVAKQADAQGNKALACIAKALMCCVDCFKRFMEYINKNAYIDIAISSNSFCIAAKNSFTFLFDNAGTIALMNGACFIFVWAGVGLVSGTCGYGAYLATMSYEPYMDDTATTYVAYPEAVGIAAGIGSMFVSMCFMNVFDMVADTLLYCYMWNKKQDPSGVMFYAPDTLAALDQK